MSNAFLSSSSGSSGSSILTIMGNSGGAVPPDGSGNINLIGVGSASFSGNSGTNTITLTVDNIVSTWTDQAGSFTPSQSTGYFITGTATANLPSSPSQGDTISFCLDTSSILTIQANTGQSIQYSTTTSSVAGTLVSTFTGDSMTLVYRSSGAKWKAVSFVGNWGST